MRYKFLRFLRNKVYKVPENVKAPKSLKIIYRILFPLNWFYQNQTGIHYDILYDMYTIEGLQITSGAIQMLKGERNGVLEVKDGAITVLGNLEKDLKDVI